jgi:hypothetical protein
LSIAEPASDHQFDATSPARSYGEIALALSNPVNHLRSISWDMEFTTYQGSLPDADDQTGLRNVFTASWPIRLNNGRNLLLRATIPVNGDQPNWKPRFYLDWADFIIRQLPIVPPGEFSSGHDHIGAIGFDIGYGGINESGFSSMFGIANVAPTSEDRSARRGQWLIGPEFALGQVRSWGLFGVRVRHLTNIYGEGEHLVEDADTNETALQFNFAYALGNGWQIESNPVIRYDWEAVSGNEWIVPIGLGVSKTLGIGRVPLKLGIEIQHFVVSPDRFGPEWLVNAMLIPVF